MTMKTHIKEEAELFKKLRESEEAPLKMANKNLADNIEWVDIHNELLKENLIIRSMLSDRIREQLLRSKENIKKSL